ncbi:MAG TPA: rod shape-determining protein RodA, partial [Candidatus Tenderia sp.]|nr:rod shape-determining protein RodA [Candidatus Tenderia sp.]
MRSPNHREYGHWVRRKPRHQPLGRIFASGFHLDWPLFLGLLLLSGLGLVVLYSSGGENIDLLTRQCIRLGLAFGVMIVMAQIPPHQLERWAPALFGLGVVMLVAVLLAGTVGKGAQRWLDLGVFRFQPSELMKLALPMMVAWYLAGTTLPPSKKVLAVAGLIIAVPTLLIVKQPDLGTSILIASSGIFALLLAGIPWKLVAGFGLASAASAPLLWFFGMHDYQRQRVLTFLNPESDPLGSGYHIIQSKIAIGSGGLFGKGWLNGTQSQLEFLPERTTDFIFAVLAEEFGFVGILVLLAVYLYIIIRGIYIATQAQDTFTRLLAGSIILTFFVYIFVNIGMVSGMLPVVGLPLPMVSYG